MKIYDLSQEVLSCCVFPGDPAPKLQELASMERGDLINLTSFSMCSHNGTHIDAPAHFLREGNTVGQIPLEKTVGYAYVADGEGEISAARAADILHEAESLCPEAAKRILIKGKSTVTLEAARVFAQRGVFLVGNESQTVGPEDSPMAVHLELLSARVVLLEGIRLSHVPAGVYLLQAAPLNLAKAEGAPCRALLLDLRE